jgi:hypothetical protein
MKYLPVPSFQWSLEQVVESDIGFALFSGDSYLESRYIYGISQVYFILYKEWYQAVKHNYLNYSSLDRYYLIILYVYIYC